MISLKRLRQIEPKLQHLSDEQVADIRERLYGMAQLAYEIHESENDSNFPLGSKGREEV